MCVCYKPLSLYIRVACHNSLTNCSINIGFAAFTFPCSYFMYTKKDIVDVEFLYLYVICFLVVVHISICLFSLYSHFSFLFVRVCIHSFIFFLIRRRRESHVQRNYSDISKAIDLLCVRKFSSALTLNTLTLPYRNMALKGRRIQSRWLSDVVQMRQFSFL